jgi:protease secretion system outer membrane protein
LANAKVDTLSEQLADMKKRFELGDATVQDLSDTEAKYNIAVSQNMEAILNKDLATAKFVEVVGLQPDNLAHIIENPKYENTSDKMDKLFDLVFSNNQNLLYKKLNLEIAKENIISNKESFYPVVDAIGSMNHYDTTDSISSIGYNSKQNYLGLQLSASLYSGGETSSRLIESQERKNQALEEYDATRKEIEYNVMKEYFGINTYVSQIKSYEMALKSSETAIEAAKVGFSVGARTQYEVLQAIEQYYNVKNSLFDSKYKYILSSLRLKMLIGELDERDFENLDFSVQNDTNNGVMIK